MNKRFVILIFFAFMSVTGAWAKNAEIFKLTTYQNPDDEEKYYATFYDSQNAYIIPDGAKAYTAIVKKDEDGETKVYLSAINGNILPKGVAVLLCTVSKEIELMVTGKFEGENDLKNDLKGVDETTSPETGTYYYMLSYGQNGLGFYKMKEMSLSAHKAYLNFVHGQVD